MRDLFPDDIKRRSSRPKFVHKLLRARDYQSRPEFENICRWWQECGEGVCALVGIGGAGKTAMVDYFLRVMPGTTACQPDIPKDPSLPAPAALLVFSFYLSPNPERFFDEVYKWLLSDFGAKDERRLLSSSRKAHATAPLVREALRSVPTRTLLVLDGLEKVQDDGLRGGIFGHIIDGGLRDFISRAADGLLPGLGVLITTRFTLDDLHYSESPNYSYVAVDKLTPEACISLLRQRGVRGTEEDLSRISAECGHHAFTVDLAGGFISYFGNGDPNTQLDFPTPEEIAGFVEGTVTRHDRYVIEQTIRFTRIAQRYREALEAKDPASLEVLEYICLFRLGALRPIVDERFAATKPAERLSLQAGNAGLRIGRSWLRLSGADLDRKLRNLEDMRLIESTLVSMPEVERSHPKVKSILTMIDRMKHAAQSAGGGVATPGGIGWVSPTCKTGGRRHKKLRFRAKKKQRRVAVYSVHPAVRDGFLHGIRGDQATSGHLTLIPQLEGLLYGTSGGVTTHDPDTLNIWEEIIYHAVEAGHKDLGFYVYVSKFGKFPTLGWRLGEFERGNRVLRAIADGRSPGVVSQIDGLDPTSETLFFNEWAKYLIALGLIEDALTCATRSAQAAERVGHANYASRAYQNIAGVLLLQGRVPEALKASDASLDYAASNPDKRSRIAGHKAALSNRAHAHALLGNVEHAQKDFAEARDAQNLLDGESNPLYSLRGIWQAQLLCRRGETDKAATLTCHNLTISAEAAENDKHMFYAHCQLVLARAASVRGKIQEAHVMLQQARAWGFARDMREILCWCTYEEARMHLQKARQEAEASVQLETLRRANASIKEGLRISRQSGFTIYHIDLLVLRSSLFLLCGQPEQAEAAARIALFGVARAPEKALPWTGTVLDEDAPAVERGVFPAEDSAWPRLLAVAHPECNYAWGERAARHTYGQSLLLRAARLVGSNRVDLQGPTVVPDKVRALVETAKRQLQESLQIGRRIGDPECAATDETLRKLAQGVLTEYPLHPLTEAAEYKAKANQTERAAYDVFLSYNSRDRAAARTLDSALLERGFSVWFDQRSLVPGRLWQEALEEIIRSSRSVAVLVGPSGLGPWENLEMRACLSEFADRRKPVIPVLLPGSVGESELPPFLRQFSCVDMREGITKDRIDRLIVGIP